jgi:hypothetical protein
MMENEKELIRRLHVVRQQGGAFFFFSFSLSRPMVRDVLSRERKKKRRKTAGTTSWLMHFL